MYLDIELYSGLMWNTYIYMNYLALAAEQFSVYLYGKINISILLLWSQRYVNWAVQQQIVLHFHKMGWEH